MDITYSSYKKENYSHCEDLVNVAWGFDKLFKSESLRTIAKYLYTKGSLVSSNYRYVAVYEGVIVGFIFGFNSSRNKHRLAAVWLGLKATIDLSFKKMDKEEKNNFIEIIKNHQINRSKVISGKNNEIVLFVVSPKFQGRGVGTKLWQGFRDYCSCSASSSIQVETNKAGASAFYERLGFNHRADFYSPLHNLATEGGQACIYEYIQKKI
ncbi:GNAT family N-acetyltransferase [Saccharophagus degradans]|uniref:GNAT family N-acetyltransferase n=1 Tax=Saccharophagus degradans TaxID=86304 RepID=A0AAW7XD32_9GAMM|nr:GNAT family N-acetyltransferase [Saccharophagus degradans]MDO6424906.1 GNAT family N-acetyltransferase [Saccharophagus degradans]MDO6609792.1 GNAT family N-acetyltransferase [Saccharophagus degradans]